MPWSILTYQKNTACVFVKSIVNFKAILWNFLSSANPQIVSKYISLLHTWHTSPAAQSHHLHKKPPMYRQPPFLFNTDVNSSGVGGSCGGVVALQQPPRVLQPQHQTNGCPSPPTSVTSNVPLLGVESPPPVQPPQTRSASATTTPAAAASCKETSLSSHP